MSDPQRILFIDADEEFRQIGTEALQEDGFGSRDGYEIVTLTDHEIGLKAIERDRDFIAVICAWKNPGAQSGYRGFKGVGLVTALRKHEDLSLRTIPVIFHTMDSAGCQRQVQEIPHVKVVSKMNTHTLPNELRALLAGVQPSH